MSEIARAFSCPACGAQVDEHARRCRYCTAPVATVRCAICFNMNTSEAAHCSGCGRDLGLEPIGEASALVCPRCQEPLARFGDGPGFLHDCAKCGGQFVEHELFRRMLVRHEGFELSARASQRGGAPADVAVRYVPCPSCRALMNRKNFGLTSGVIVDVCKLHGTWFDLGELPRVLSFVEQGGLARAKQREIEEHHAKLRADAAASARATIQAGSEVRPELISGTSFASLLWDILVH